MPDHREAAAALQADVGCGEVWSEQFSSCVVTRDDPCFRASAFMGNGRWYITISGADDDLARAILRLVVEARERATTKGE